MSEMITRAEAAIAEAVLETGDREFISKLGLFLEGNPGLIGRAAIEAIRETTPQMIEDAAGESYSGEVSETDFSTCWKAIIDGALK